jgi:hypothetical protein
VRVPGGLGGGEQVEAEPHSTDRGTTGERSRGVSNPSGRKVVRVRIPPRDAARAATSRRTTACRIPVTADAPDTARDYACDRTRTTSWRAALNGSAHARRALARRRSRAVCTAIPESARGLSAAPRMNSSVRSPHRHLCGGDLRAASDRRDGAGERLAGERRPCSCRSPGRLGVEAPDRLDLVAHGVAQLDQQGGEGLERPAIGGDGVDRPEEAVRQGVAGLLVGAQRLLLAGVTTRSEVDGARRGARRRAARRSCRGRRGGP